MNTAAKSAHSLSAPQVLLGLVLYAAFLGTSIATVSDGQQLNFSLVLCLFSFLLLAIFGAVAQPSLRVFTPLALFMLASVPGTLLHVLKGGAPAIPLAQYVGMLVLWTVVVAIFRQFNLSALRVFSAYLHCAKLCALVGVVQQLGYLARIEVLYDLRWFLVGAASLDYSGPFLRVASLFTEPSYFAAFLMPALYFSVLRLAGRSRLLGVAESMLLVVGLMCTFSTIGYLGLLICVLAALNLSLRNIAIAAVIFGVLVTVAIFDPSISSRLSAVPNALQSELSGDENLSTLINGLNLAISKDLITDYPVFGVGLGGYRVHSLDYLNAFVEANPALQPVVNGIMDQLTLADGGSMYLRLVTELGLGGCTIAAYLFFTRRQPAINPLHTHISRAALLFIVIFSIRSGQLVRFDFIFFCALYSLIRYRSFFAPRAPNLERSPHD